MNHQDLSLTLTFVYIPLSYQPQIQKPQQSPYSDITLPSVIKKNPFDYQKKSYFAYLPVQSLKNDQLNIDNKVIQPSSREKNKQELFTEHTSTQQGALNKRIPHLKQQSETPENPQYLGFNTEERKSFIRKVYSILTLQLLVNFLIVMITYSCQEFRKFQQDFPELLIFAIVISVCIQILMAFFPKQSWIVPQNYIFLVIFTISMSWMVSTFFGYIFEQQGLIGAQTVLMAVINCIWIVVGLTSYAYLTKKDFTTLGFINIIQILKGSILWLICFDLFCFTISVIIFRGRIKMLIFSFLSCLLLGLLFIFDTQLILGGKVIIIVILQFQIHEYKIDDYIVASLLLYTDIITIFLYLLKILIQKSKN